MRATAGTILLLMLSSGASAAVNVSLPLAGYYRPGKCVPVQFSVSAGEAGRNATFRIASDGAIATRIALADGHAQGTAPLYVLSLLKQAHWRFEDGRRHDLPSGAIAGPWQALSPDQRLVAFTGADTEIAAKLFPGANIVPVQLAQPPAGSAIAWSSLDALVLDSAIDDRRIGDFLAVGVTIAIRGETAPDARWPWRRVGSYWVLSHDPAGPRRAGENQPAMAPVQGWEAEWPGAFRRRVLLYAVGFSIAALGLGIVRWRHRSSLTLGLSLAVVVALGFWWRGRTPVLQQGGQVVLLGSPILQTDTWTYRASARTHTDRMAVVGPTWPVFEGTGHAEAMRFALDCGDDGEVSQFEYTLRPGLKAAFVSRGIEPRRVTLTPESPDGSPLARLGRRVYQRQDQKIWGLVESDAPAGWSIPEAHWWGTLVVERTGLE